MSLLVSIADGTRAGDVMSPFHVLHEYLGCADSLSKAHQSNRYGMQLIGMPSF